METGLRLIDETVLRINEVEWIDNLSYNIDLVVSYKSHLYGSLINDNIGHHPVTSGFWTFII